MRILCHLNKITWSPLMVAVMLLAGLGSGCSSDSELMPTPNIYAHSEVNPFAEVPPALQNNRVNVLYLTDRQRERSKTEAVEYGFKRSRSVALGISEVAFGKDVPWDKLVAASRTSDRKVDLPVQIVKTTEILRFAETPKIILTSSKYAPAATNPSDDVIALQADTKAKLKQASDVLSAELAKSPDKEVYLFIHGYNNSFADSVETIAQLWHFMGRRGVPIAYSWPAGRGGLLRGYTYDRESSEFTVYHLKEAIRDIAACPDVKKIHLIAHSRGTGVLVSALAELHLEVTGSGQKTRDVLKLGTVVLAAPDIDLDVLIQRAMTIRLGIVPERTVIYVNSRDNALGISNWLFGGLARLGDARTSMFGPEELSVLRTTKSLQFIDANVSTGIIGHDYFHSDPAVSSDLVLLMRYQRLPGIENGRPLQVDGNGFWKIGDNYPGNLSLPTTQPSAP